MRRYESYKDSGVEWLGEIPSHWEMQRSKFLFKKIERKVKEIDQIVTCFRDGQVTLRANRRTDGFTNALKEHGYQGIRKGDLVIHAMDAFAGAIGVSDSDGKATPVYSVCLPYNKQKVNVYFYAYYLRNLALSGFITSLAKGIRERSTDFRYADFAELLLPLPSYSEQQKIAQFLDDKTAKIDQAVDLAEKQIALLKEHKQILIQNAVTRGLNPDVPLKDSGVEWLGDVPAHWDIKRLKFMLSEKLKYGANESAESDDPEQPRYIRITDIDEQGNLKDDTFKSLEFEKAKDYLLNVNDILLARSGTVGKSYLYKENLKNFACYAGYLIRVRLEQKKFNAEFVNYYFQSIGYWNWIKSVNIQATIQNVSAEKYNDFLLSVPNLQEQATIVDYLDQKTAKIDQAIALKTAHIEKLKEYKSVLINDVVTGKVQVLV